MIAPTCVNPVNPQTAGLGLLGPHASRVSSSECQEEDDHRQRILLPTYDDVSNVD